jgi:hypothetical protein
MDKSSIRKEIAALINSIKEHSDNIGTNENIPQLELELILHKIEKLYQKSIVFNYLNTVPVNNEPKPQIKAAVVESVKEQPAPEVQKTKVETAPVNTTPVVDLFGSELSSSSEKPKVEKKVVKKEQPPVISKIQKPSISDLRAAIGINDKFLFANELFRGNITEYDVAIQQLNAAGSIESAMDYFLSLQQLYNWDLENEVVKRLTDLIDRRYS